jgi:hypothetical protein
MPRPTIYLIEPQHEYLLCGPTCYRMVVLTSLDRTYRNSAGQSASLLLRAHPFAAPLLWR